MGIFKVKNVKTIEKLFEGWNETLIWSCLQGCMGSAYADKVDSPESAQIIIADFCFFAGKENEELVRNKPSDYKSNFIIMVPQNEKWSKLIEKVYKENSLKVNRYAIKKEKDIFNVEKLNKIVSGINRPFKVQDIDKEMYNKVMKEKWSKDLCSHFKDYENYKNRGMGVVVTDNGMVVSGAASYTVYNEGIEIEIDTRQDYRRRGLALICGAKLILECINVGLYPSWDAQNKGSVALAEKLGYHFDKEYVAYEVTF